MKLIILDRDGVINYDSLEYIKTPEEWIEVPGSLQAIVRLNQAGYSVAIATNQSGIARGLYDEKMLTAIHQKMLSALSVMGGRIDTIVYCPHLPEDNCLCRKPKPGMLLQIANFFNCSLQKVVFIGDKQTDVAAAQAVNATPILVKSAMLQSVVNDVPVSSVPYYVTLAEAIESFL